MMLLNELKKLFTGRIMLVLALVNVICFYLLIDFYITHFPNGRPQLDLYHVGVEMVDKYGTTMDEREYEDFKNTYERQTKEAEAFLQANEEFRENGILSYEDFMNLGQTDEQFASELHWNVLKDEDAGDLFWELQAREYIMEWYEQKEESIEGWIEYESPQQRARLDELKAAGQFKYFPSGAFSNFKEFIFNVAITVILSVVLVISPLFLRDHRQKVVALQYTSKKGRTLFKTKIAAGMIAAFIVITVLLIGYFSIYTLNKTAVFFDQPIALFIETPAWYDLTFFHYIVLSVLAVYALGFIFALFSMACSSIVRNYVSLIGVQVPVVIAMFAYGLHGMIRGMIDLWRAPWVVPALYSGLLILGVLLMIFIWKREQKKDLFI